MEISYHRTLVCIHVHVCECVNVCMSMWVTHHYPASWASSSDAHLSALLLHTEPSEPSAVYTLPLLLLTLSLFISLTHSHAHLFSLRLPYFLHLPPAPYSTSLILTHSRSLVFLGFSLTNRPPSLFITVPLHCVSTSADQDLFRLRQSLYKVQTDTQG